MIERQTKARMGKYLDKFSCLKFMIAGEVPENPDSQELATVDMRTFIRSCYELESFLLTLILHRYLRPDPRRRTPLRQQLRRLRPRFFCTFLY